MADQSKPRRSVSNAPPPIKPIQGGGFVRPTPDPARWNVWRLMPTVKLWQAIALSLDMEPTDRLRDEAFRGKPERLLKQEYFDRLMVCHANVGLQGPIAPQGGLYRGMLTDPGVSVLAVDVARYLVQAGFAVPTDMASGTSHLLEAVQQPVSDGKPLGHAEPTQTEKRLRLSTKEHPLTAVIEKARDEATDPNGWMSVWAQLVRIVQADSRPAPTLGYVEGEGIKYQFDESEEPRFYKKGSLQEQFRRAKLADADGG